MRELYRDGYLIGWDAQHEAARRELAEAKACINEQCDTIRQLERLVSEQSREIEMRRRLTVVQLATLERMRLQRAVLVSALCVVVAWWLLG